MMKNPKNSEEFRLQTRHKKAIEMLVYQGLTQKEIAEEVRVNETTVSDWINNNPTFQKLYDRELEKAAAARHRIYKSKAQKAVLKLEKLMSCGNSAVELAAAREILDRAGDKPEETISTRVTVESNPYAELTTDELRKLARLADDRKT